MANVRMDEVGRVFQLIINNWALSRKLDYTVLSTGPVHGVPIDEYRDSEFWVGVGSDGEIFSLVEMVNCFQLLGQNYQQLKKLPKGATEARTNSYLNHSPSDAVIRKIIDQVEVTVDPTLGGRA